jgi:hypothetical protein
MCTCVYRGECSYIYIYKYMCLYCINKNFIIHQDTVVWYCCQSRKGMVHVLIFFRDFFAGSRQAIQLNPFLFSSSSCEGQARDRRKASHSFHTQLYSRAIVWLCCVCLCPQGTIVDNPMTCCGKSTKYFKRKIYIILRICGIGYVLSNCDYLFVNIEILENMYIKR